MRRVFWLALLLLAACAGGLAQKPEISLASLDLVGFGLFEQRFLLKLRIENPNDVDLPIEGLSFDVELNGEPFARGVSAQAVSVPRAGEALLEVRATSNLGGVLKQLRALPKDGRERIGYRISGQVTVGGLGSRPFERRGDLPLPLFGKPAAPKLESRRSGAG